MPEVLAEAQTSWEVSHLLAVRSDLVCTLTNALQLLLLRLAIGRPSRDSKHGSFRWPVGRRLFAAAPGRTNRAGRPQAPEWGGGCYFSALPGPRAMDSW